jgi:excisionase family DNA binding protein
MADAQSNSGTRSVEEPTLAPHKPYGNVRSAPNLPSKNSPHFLNADEAAQVLRMDSRTLVRWARLGQVPAHPLGEGKRRLWRFIESELIHWLEQRGAPLRKSAASNIETAIGAHARRTA